LARGIKRLNASASEPSRFKLATNAKESKFDTYRTSFNDEYNGVDNGKPSFNGKGSEANGCTRSSNG
jgi:hypothetical protein